MNKEKVIECLTVLLQEGLCLDLTDPNLQETPNRIAKMYCNEFFCNTHSQPPDNLITVFPNSKGYNEIVMLDNIPFTSICSHHFLPFSGKAYFLYLPNEYLLGASKPARVVEFFSHRPQLQENLSQEILDYIVSKISPKGAMLVMRAVHGCMSCRGINSGLDAGLMTSITQGIFRSDPTMEAKGFDLIKLSTLLR